MIRTANTFYQCDPYTPGIYPKLQPSTDFFPNPFNIFGAELRSDLVGDDGQVVAAAGTKVIELGVTAPSPDYVKNRQAVGGALTLLGLSLSVMHDILADPHDTIVSAQERANIIQCMGDTLPNIVVGHTRQSVGAVAVRDFGFAAAGSTDSIPTAHLEAITATGEAPMTVYMATEQFRAMTTPDEL
jgi:hypothetical protein